MLCGLGVAGLAVAALAGAATRGAAPASAAATTSARAGSRSVPAPLVSTDGNGAIPGQYVVVLKDSDALSAAGASSPAGSRAASSASSASSRELAQAVQRGKRLGAGVHRTFDHAFAGYAATLSPRQLAGVRADPAVAYVQPDQRYRVTTTQDDPPWGLNRIDQRTLPLNHDYYYTGTGAGVTAYIVDTGIRSTHLDFTQDALGKTVPSRVSGGICSIPLDDGTIGCDQNGTQDCYGHGTHVAGIAGGTRYGVAKKLSLVPIRVLACDGTSSSAAVAAGLDWIVQNHTSGPAVANLSLSNDGGSDPVVEAAVQRVIAAGVSVVIAAGNGDVDGNGVSACSVSPSDVKAAITVGASTRTDERATFSNYGSCVDLYAPGVGVWSDWDSSASAIAKLDGTSMATPYVTGAIALYLQQHPTATPAQVQTAIVGSATANQITNVSSRWPRRLLFALQPVSPPTTTVSSTALGGALTSGTAILRGQRVCSPNPLYCLSQRSSDGVLVLSKPGGRVLWSNRRPAAWTVLGATGDLVSYDAYGRWVWSTGTSRVGISTLRVRNDGDVVLSNNGTGVAEWTTKTAQKRSAPPQGKTAARVLTSGFALYRAGAVLTSQNGRFTFALRGDGDLVLSKVGVGRIWHTGAKDDDWLKLQSNGNLVLWNAKDVVLWSTHTLGRGAARLELHNTGNLALVRVSDGRVLWSTGTSGA